MGWPKLLLVLFTFYRSFASDGFFGILLVVGELSDSFVVAELRWVGRFKGLVVLDSWSSLGLRSSMGNNDILLEDLPVRVESISLLSSLREGLILKHGGMIVSLYFSNRLWSVIVVLHVRDSTRECHILTNLTLLDWISANVGWH